MSAGGASALRERVRFEQKGLDADNLRNGEWDADGDGFDVACEITWLRRGEEVMQMRQKGQSPAILKVWSSAATRAVTNAWRAVDLRTDRVFALKSPGEPSADRGFIEFLANADGSDDGPSDA